MIDLEMYKDLLGKGTTVDPGRIQAAALLSIAESLQELIRQMNEAKWMEKAQWG